MALTSITGDSVAAALAPARSNAQTARPREQVFSVPDEPARAAPVQAPAAVSTAEPEQAAAQEPVKPAPTAVLAETTSPDKDKKAATETATAGTGSEMTEAVNAALAGAAALRAAPPANGAAPAPGGATPDAVSASAVPGATATTVAAATVAATAATPANLVVGASGKTEKVAADLGASTDQPAVAGKAAPAKPVETTAKLATPAKADQTADAKPDTKPDMLGPKPDAVAAKRKDAVDTPTVKTGDQAAAAQASATATSPVKAEAGADAARAAVAAAPPPPQSNLPPTPLQTVPIEIGLQALRNGSSTFQIRLDPEELGRVEVKLHISGDSKVSASLVVDRVETLHMLQREAKTLERAFEQAGLKSNGDDLQFSLRQDGRGQDGSGQDTRQQGGAGQTPPSGGEEDLAAMPIPPALQRLTMSRALAGGLDIQI